MSELQRMKVWNTFLVGVVVVMAAWNTYDSHEWEQVAEQAQMTSERCLGQLQGIEKTLDAMRGR